MLVFAQIFSLSLIQNIVEMFNEKKNKNKKSKTIVFFTIGPMFNKHGKDNFMIIFVQAYPVLKFLEAQNMID